MKKTIMMTVGAVALFAGIGFGVGTVVGGSADAQTSKAGTEITHDNNTSENSDHNKDTTEHASSDTGDHSNASDGDHGEKKKEPVVVEIGRVMVPIYNPRSITYVIAELGFSISDPKKADSYKEEGYVNKVRNDVLEVMVKMSETEVFNELYVDTDAISFSLHQALKKEYDYIDEVLFLNFVKQELKRG